jgi:hypothetical protein
MSGTGAATAGTTAMPAAGSMAPAAGTTATGTAGTAAMPAAGTGTGTTAGTGATTAGTGATMGPAGTGAAGMMSSGGAAPTLQMVYETVYVTNCAVCHGMAPSPSANGNLGNVKGGKDTFFQMLVNKPAQGPQCMGKGMYIVPGNPAMSLLLQKVSSTPPCGVEMPVGGMLQPTEVKMISDWIMAGALNN